MSNGNIVRSAALIVLAGALNVAAVGDGTIVFEGCTGLQLSLDGAVHYYWIAPEHDRAVLVRACGPVEADCDHDVVTVWDREGDKIFEAAPFLDIPGMTDGSVLDAALRTPDRLVLSATVGTTDFTPVLAEYDVDTGELLRVVPTGSIQCLDLHGDDEGVTWCLGRDVTMRRNDEDFDLVYRFDEVGALQSSALPRSAFPASAQPLAETQRGNFRGGFLRGDGPVRLWLPAVGELISFSDRGKVSDRLKLPAIDRQQRAHLVSNPDSAVYAMLIAGDESEPDEWRQGLYRLANDGASWLPLAEIPNPIPRQIALVGANGNGLILVDRKTLALCGLPIPTQGDPGN